MKTMTIRNIPDEVAAYISGRASEEGRSINTMTVAILTRALGRPVAGSRRCDDAWFAGPRTDSGNVPHDNGLGKFRGTLSKKTGDELLKFVAEADFSKVDPEDR